MRAFSPPPRLKCDHATGFTLIEVLAALIIISLGMLAVIQAVSQTASNGTYLREKTIAHWVGMNRVTEMRLAPYANVSLGESTGEVEMAGQRWQWKAEVTATQVATMRRIDVRVIPLTEGNTNSDNNNQLAMVTGFIGEKIAQPGQINAQWNTGGAVDGNGGIVPPPPDTQ